jgi:amino acid permease
VTREQKIVAVGAVSGVLAMIASVATISHLWPIKPGLADVGSRLAYALQLNAFAMLPLLVGVVTVGNNRFLSDAIDPTLHKENLATQINGRVVDNTLQQSILFLVGTLALSVSLTGPQMRVIAAATLVFIVARFAFWIGYRLHPLYRAPGMAATGYLNIGILAFAIWKALP